MSTSPTLNDIELENALSMLSEPFKSSLTGSDELTFHVFSLIDDAFERGITQDVVSAALEKYLASKK